MIMVSIVVPLLIISTIIAPIMELVSTSPIIILIVVVVVVVLEPTLVMVVTSVANLVVPFHFVARLLHVVVVSLLVRLHVVVPLVMGVHVVVSLMLRLLLLLLLDHLRALTELRWRMIEAVGVLQLVDRGRLVLYMLALLVLHMMALLMLYMLPLLVLHMVSMLMTRWWLLHLHLLLHVRMMLGLVAPLMVKRDCIAISHSRVAGIMKM